MKLYRCWILWRQPLVMVIPCILSLAFLGANLQMLITDFRTNFTSVTALTTLSLQIKSTVDDHSEIFLLYDFSSASTAFFFISLAVNAIVTALIVYRIITVYNDIRGFNSIVQASSHRNGRRDLHPLISILIESGLVTFIGQLAQPIMYNSASEAFPLVIGCVVMLYVRALNIRLLIWYLSTRYTGNFNDGCPCARRDGHFVRSKCVEG